MPERRALLVLPSRVLVDDGSGRPVPYGAGFSPYPYGYDPGGRPSASIYQRTAADGTVFDVRANRYQDGSASAGPPWWEPLGWCYPSGELYVGVRAVRSVGQARSLRYDEVRAGALTVTTAVVGVPEEDPRWWRSSKWLTASAP